MLRTRSAKLQVGLALVVLLLAGCGAGAPQPVTPTPYMDTPIPTATLPPPTQVTTATAISEHLRALWPIAVENASGVRLLRTMAIPGYHKGQVSQCSVAFSPDGRLLVGACGSNQVPVWEVGSGLLRYLLYEASQHSVACSFSPSGDILALGGFDEMVTLWDTGTGESLGNLGSHDSPVWDIDFSPDARRVVSVSFGGGPANGDVRLWGALDGQMLWSYSDSGVFLSVSYHPSGETLAYGDARGDVAVLDAATGETMVSLSETRKAVGDVAYSSSGGLLAAASDDNNIYLWGTSDYQLIATLEGHRHFVNGLAFGPDDTLLVSGSHDRTLAIWDVSKHQLLKTLEGHEDEVLRVAFSPDGKLIASISWDGTIRLWGVPAG